MIDNGTISAERRLYAHGSFGAGTITLQRTPDGGTTMIDVGTLSANGVIDFDVMPGEEYNLNMTGSTTPDVDWKVF